MEEEETGGGGGGVAPGGAFLDDTTRAKSVVGTVLRSMVETMRLLHEFRAPPASQLAELKTRLHVMREQLVALRALCAAVDADAVVAALAAKSATEAFDGEESNTQVQTAASDAAERDVLMARLVALQTRKADVGAKLAVLAAELRVLNESASGPPHS